MICGGRYMSGDEPLRVFAAGSPTNVLTNEVSWRSGKRSVVSGAQANRIYEIEEAGASDSPALTAVQNIVQANVSSLAEVARPLFMDVSEAISHIHVDELFDDFARQPLLSSRLS